MKYIIFRDDSVALFSNFCDHKIMANGRLVKSAGFCCFETCRNSFDDIVCKQVRVYGESISLKVKSREEDAGLIKEAIGVME